MRLIRTLTLITLLFSGCALFKPAAVSTPSLPQLPPSREESRALMEAACQGAPALGGDGAWYCGFCPLGTSWAGEASETHFAGVIRGSFTRAGVLEALVHLRGCEPHANNFGGLLLLRQKNKKWRRVRYLPAFVAQECLSYVGNAGRDEVLCEIVWEGQGQQVVALTRLAWDRERPRESKLITYGSNEGASQIDARQKSFTVTRENWRIARQDRDTYLNLELKLQSSGEIVSIRWKLANPPAPANPEDRTKVERISAITAGIASKD